MLLRGPCVVLDDPLAEIKWSRFPLKAMAERGWIQDVPKLLTQAEGLIRDLIERAGGAEVVNAALYRKNDQVCRNAKTTPYALQAWCWRILATANKNPPKVSYESGTVTLDFLKQVARLSRLAAGPQQAKEFLDKHGIPLVIVPHLPRTYQIHPAIVFHRSDSCMTNTEILSRALRGRLVRRGLNPIEARRRQETKR